MTTLGSALNSALSALVANQTGLAVASNNIANANTPGFTRQRVVMQAAPRIGEMIPVGTGVMVTGTESMRDQLIDRRLWKETSGQAGGDLTHQTLSDIETMFNESGNTGLLPLLSDFYNSFQKLSTNPASTDLRQQVANSSASLAQFINERAGDLRDMKTSVDHSIKDDVSKANTLINQIADITKSIQEQENTEPANDLRDQRSSLIQQLSSIVNVKEMDSSGGYQLTTGNNRPLVTNGAASPLTTATTEDGTTTVLSGSTDITSEFSDGTLAARIALRDQTIPQYSQALDQMAYDLARQVNAIHSVSYDQDGNTGTNFFVPIDGVANAASRLQLNPDIVKDTRKIAVSSQSAGSDNQSAIAIGNLLNAADSSRGSVTDQYRALVFQIGSETANAQIDASQHQSMLTQLENRRASSSGVSIDEEATSILQFQRAYQASARVVSTVDQLLQVTLNMGA